MDELWHVGFERLKHDSFVIIQAIEDRSNNNHEITMIRNTQLVLRGPDVISVRRMSKMHPMSA